MCYTNNGIHFYIYGIHLFMPNTENVLYNIEDEYHITSSKKNIYRHVFIRELSLYRCLQEPTLITRELKVIFGIDCTIEQVLKIVFNIDCLLEPQDLDNVILYKVHYFFFHIGAFDELAWHDGLLAHSNDYLFFLMGVKVAFCACPTYVHLLTPTVKVHIDHPPYCHKTLV
ncbi:hypothetical protein ACJX0J_037573, partial [Zea mays]